MLYFIHPIDESTQFLDEVYSNVIEALGDNAVTVYTFKNKEAEEIAKTIRELPIESNLYFLGHGRSDRLYGVMSESDEPFVGPKEMTIFNGKNLFTLACHSTALLSTSFRNTDMKNAIGFGHLPTSVEEVQAIRKIRKIMITDGDLDEFKRVIVNCVSNSLIYTFQKKESFAYLHSLLRLMLHKEMNKAVLDNKNRAVANLIYQMCDQMSYFSK